MNRVHGVVTAVFLAAVPALAVVAACGGKTVTPAGPGAMASATWLEQLAAELDPGPRTTLWPTLPEVARTQIQAGVAEEAGGDQARKLAAATERLAAWRWEVDESWAVLTLRVRALLEGIYLAEPIAFAPGSAEAMAAATVLVRTYAQLEDTTFAEWIVSTPTVPVDRQALVLLAANANQLRRYFSAQVLRGGSRDQIAQIVRDEAERITGRDAKRAREVYVNYIAMRGAAATAEDWALVVGAHVRVEDRAAAGAALQKLAAVVGPVPASRREASHLKLAQLDLELLDKLLAIGGGSGASTDVAMQIQRFDLLRRLRRTRSAAGPLIESLAAAHPNDARVRVRTAVVGFETMTDQQQLTSVMQLADALEDPLLTNRDGDYWSLLIGATVMKTMAAALPELERDPVNGAQKTRDAFAALGKYSTELARSNPGRAAALQFLLQRLGMMVDRMQKPELGPPASLLRLGFADAIALRAKYPEEGDVDRIVLMLAAFTTDRKAALAAVTQQVVTSGDDDGELLVQRGRAAVSMALEHGNAEVLAQMRLIVDAMPLTVDPSAQAAYEACAGDLEALEARAGGDGKALWAKAEAHYRAALTIESTPNARVLNNLGYAVLMRGDAAAAQTLFERSVTVDESMHIPRLNIALLRSAEARLAGVREVVERLRSEGPPPPLLEIWIAGLTQDPAESEAAARRAMAEYATPLQQMKPVVEHRGIHAEGNHKLGISLDSIRFYVLNLSADFSPWFTPPTPLDRAGLAVRAKIAPGRGE